MAKYHSVLSLLSANFQSLPQMFFVLNFQWVRVAHWAQASGRNPSDFTTVRLLWVYRMEKSFLKGFFSLVLQLIHLFSIFKVSQAQVYVLIAHFRTSSIEHPIQFYDNVKQNGFQNEVDLNFELISSFEVKIEIFKKFWLYGVCIKLNWVFRIF